jgi:hypothetical protein
LKSRFWVLGFRFLVLEEKAICGLAARINRENYGSFLGFNPGGKGKFGWAINGLLYIGNQEPRT